MKLAPANWPNSLAANNVLFVAQLLQEMLSDTTFESFRAYSLDTVTRLDEAAVVASDIIAGRIPEKAFLPVNEELLWSLRNDPIAKQVAPDGVKSFLDVASNKGATINELKSLVRWLSRKLRKSYRATCEKRLLELCLVNNQRIELRQVVGFYCSYLLNVGYTKAFLSRYVNGSFFLGNYADVGTVSLQRFLKALDEVSVAFQVVCLVPREFATYLKSAGVETSDLSASPLYSGISAMLPRGVNDTYALIRSEQYDEDGAVAHAHAILTALHSFTSVAPALTEVALPKEMYVARVGANVGVLLPSPTLPLKRRVISTGASRKALKNLTEYSGRIVTNFNTASTRRILSCLNANAVAHAAPTIDIQLSSLWSTIEILLSEPRPNTPRITHYVSVLLPCICLRYMRRQFTAVFDELLVLYKKKFTAIVNQECNIPAHDQHTKFAAIICVASNKLLQQDLLSLCSSNPLALHKIWRLQRDFSTPSAMREAIENHAKRVNWQLHRIYRARNNLVHAGRKFPFYDSLVLNLDEYFRVSFGNIVRRAAMDENQSDVDEMVSDLVLDYRGYTAIVTDLRKKPTMTVDLLQSLVH